MTRPKPRNTAKFRKACRTPAPRLTHLSQAIRAALLSCTAGCIGYTSAAAGEELLCGINTSPTVDDTDFTVSKTCTSGGVDITASNPPFYPNGNILTITPTGHLIIDRQGFSGDSFHIRVGEDPTLDWPFIGSESGQLRIQGGGSLEFINIGNDTSRGFTNEGIVTIDPNGFASLLICIDLSTIGTTYSIFCI